MPVHQYSKSSVKEAPTAPVYDSSTALGRARIKGYMGGARKIRIQNVPGSESNVVGPFYVGTIGPFTMRRGFDLIVPDEVVESFNSANGVMTKQCDFDNINQKTGHIPLVDVPVEPRFPFVDYGEASWEDYEAFLDEQRKKSDNPTRR